MSSHESLRETTLEATLPDPVFETLSIIKNSLASYIVLEAVRRASSRERLAGETSRRLL